MWQAIRGHDHCAGEGSLAVACADGLPTKRGVWYTPFWLDRLIFKVPARSADRIVPAKLPMERP
jgi:hypothetical protein